MKRFIFLNIVSFVLVLNAQGNRPLYYMFSDNKARQVNDLVTIVVSEQANAQNSTANNSSTQQGTNFSVGPGIGGWSGAVGEFGAGTKWDNSYKGSGTTAKSGSIQTTITAKILKVMENGNFQIEGTKKLMINGEEELINISGEVRPDDIGANNTVSSTKLANVEISYKGQGAMYDGAKAGLITCLFNWLF